MKYETQRQQRVLDEGSRVEQETRGWSDERAVTFSQRSKEYAHDYRYFPEPDLPPIVIQQEWVDQLRSQLPELPAVRRKRFSKITGSQPTTPASSPPPRP